MNRKKTSPQWELTTAVLAAILASICCLGPLLLVALGVSGAWISNLAAFEQYRPFFIALTLGLLGFGFYRVYWNPKVKECQPGSACANPRANQLAKKTLIIGTAFVLGLLAFPYAVPYVFTVNATQKVAKTKQVVLQIENMTCEACPVTVRSSLVRLDGVEEAIVTFNPPEAIIVYDPAKVTIKELMQVTTNVGYPSSVKSQ